MEAVQLFDLPIQNLTLDEAVRLIVECLSLEKATRLFFVNAHCINVAQENSQYQAILQKADFLFGDGIGISIAAQWLSQSLRDNVNGTDLFPHLCEALRHTDFRIFLLGAKPGVAELKALKMREQYPGLKICGTHHGFFADEECETVAQKIRETETHLLLVAMGVPRQELWIDRYLEASGARVAMGVGGLFQFYSGQVPRAPMWMRRTGLEWLHRLWQEPRRLWRRYLIGNLVFLWRVFLEGRKKS